MGRDGRVCIKYSLRAGGLGIESRWGRDFPHPSRPFLRTTQPPVQWVPGLCGGVKRPERYLATHPTSSAEVKEGVQLYFYPPPSLSGPSWPFTFCLLWLLHSNNDFIGPRKSDSSYTSYLCRICVSYLCFSVLTTNGVH